LYSNHTSIRWSKFLQWLVGREDYFPLVTIRNQVAKYGHAITVTVSDSDC